MDDIILASGSAARKRSLATTGLQFRIESTSFLDESKVIENDPEKRAVKLAELKALGVACDNTRSVVIGADMYVEFQGRILEKPASKEEAFQTLKKLSNQTFHVISAVAVACGGLVNSKLCKSEVTFRELEDNEIRSYISRYPVMNFSASFNEDGALLFTKESNGCPHFVGGFHLGTVIELLREFNVDI